MITLDNFENFVPYKILTRGEEYYDNDAVSELEETSPGEWTATVEGTDEYNVEISMNGKNVESWYCDCPYDGEICKHVVAVLLTIRDKKRKSRSSASSKKTIVIKEEKPVQPDADIQRLLSFVKPQELSRYISEYASTNPEFKAGLLNHFIAKESSSTSKGKDYGTEILKAFNGSGGSKRSRYYNRYNDYDYIRDWETIFNQMDIFLKKADFLLTLGDIDNVTVIALQILRSLGENYDDELLYDEDLDVPSYCERAGDLLMKVVGHSKTTQKQKEDIVQELRKIAEISVYRDYDLYDVDELMMQINLSIQPTEKALELIDGLLKTRKDAYDLYQLVFRKVNLLLELHEEQKANDTIRQYLYLPEVRNMEVKKLIAGSRYDEAIRLLDEGIEIAEKEMHPGIVNEWLEMKLEVYERAHRTSEAIDMCRQLFVTGSDKLVYYNKLKALIPKEQWKDFLYTMMKETNFGNYFFFNESVEADIYVKEKDYERLFTFLSSVRCNQLEALMSYAHFLKDTHSEQLIAIYTSLLNDYAERNMGREHYEFVARALSCVGKLKGGQDAVKNIVAEFRIKYKRRPAMMEVLDKF